MDSYGAATLAENITSTIDFRNAEGASLSVNQTTYPTWDTAIITSSITFDTRVIETNSNICDFPCSFLLFWRISVEWTSDNKIVRLDFCR